MSCSKIRMRSLHTVFVLMGMLACGTSRVRAGEEAADSAAMQFFEKKVRPILATRCYECHSQQAGKQKGGLRLDDRGAILKGGDSGAAAEPGKVDTSLIVEVIRNNGDGIQMPPTGKLPQSEIDVLVDWVRRGLPHPSAAASKAAKSSIDWEQGRRHWAFQPVTQQALPAGTDQQANRIDAFIHDALRRQKLEPSPRADARTLIRRASFDLLGLPPSPADVDAFAAEFAKEPDAAYAKLIDRLLASPHYGERWGRYWLDLARYADITEEWREGFGEPWRYRDWVVQALNADMPYNEFVRQQLAADLLPGAKPEDNAALGFLSLSPTYWKELQLEPPVIKQIVADEWEEHIDAIGSTFLGLTVACARCHDHKFDPISTQDYYAMAGVLASVRDFDRALIDEKLAAPAMKARERAKVIETDVRQLGKKKKPSDAEKKKLGELQKELEQLKKTPHFDLPVACGIIDASLYVVPNGKAHTKLDYRPGTSQDLAMHIRGNPVRTGEVVTRRFLTVLAKDQKATFRRGSGRLDLADAIVNDAAPLTARVIVNRVWENHFGRGLVDTPSNFGKQGSPPSHPALLEDLTARFVEHDWSLKWLHRELMTSATYQQSSHRDATRNAIDPENKLLWRMVPRRLEVEAWRDALLAACGELDRSVGGAPVDLAEKNNHRRTIYGIVKRRELNELLRLHDFPDPLAHAAHRTPTTTPLQQLFVLNGDLFQRQSSLLVTRLEREAPSDGAGRVAWLYRMLFQREARPVEKETGVQFVSAVMGDGAKPAEAWRQYVHAMLATNEFLFVD